MTVQSEKAIIRYPYTGPGDYIYEFTALLEEDLQCVYFDTEGIPFDLHLGTDYTVTLDQDYVGGTVHFLMTETDGYVEIRRYMLVEQNVDYVNNNPLDMEVLEKSFDRLTMMIQDGFTIIAEGTITTNWRGNWVSGVIYETMDLVTAPNGSWYACKVDHISGTSFDDDLAAGYWVLALDVEAIENHRIAAEAAAAAAAQSEQNAAVSEQNAHNSELAAAASATNAATSEQNAAQSATDASFSASSAATSEQNAATSEGCAEEWAQNPEDVPVSCGDGTQYSAYHWSEKAKEHASGITDINAISPLAVDKSDPMVPVIYLEKNLSTPVGTICAWQGGYYSDTANGSFTNVLGNDVATVNTLLNPEGWYVCDGAEVNVVGSPIFDGGGRHVPNLTDQRFIMGFTEAGGVGGSNTMEHTHSVDIGSFTSGNTTLTIDQMPSHNHIIEETLVTTICMDNRVKNAIAWDGSGTPVSHTGGSGAHNHSVDPPGVTSGQASLTENRPLFLRMFYIMKVV